MSGCAIYDQRELVTYGHNGQPIPEGAVDAIQPQKTTRTWVLENLGEPDRISAGPNQTEIFTYRFERSLTKRIRVFLLFSHRKTIVEEKHIFVHFVGDTVHKFWRDYELPALPDASFNIEIKPSVEVKIVDVAPDTSTDNDVFAAAAISPAIVESTGVSSTGVDSTGVESTVVASTVVATVNIATTANATTTTAVMNTPQSQSTSVPSTVAPQANNSDTSGSHRPVWSAPLDSASNGVDHY